MSKNSKKNRNTPLGFIGGGNNIKTSSLIRAENILKKGDIPKLKLTRAQKRAEERKNKK